MKKDTVKDRIKAIKRDNIIMIVCFCISILCGVLNIFIQIWRAVQ